MKITDTFIICILIFVMCIYGCETALERPLEKEKVLLIAPADSVISTFSDQTFSWEQTTGATAYQLQIVAPDFDRIERLITDTTISKNTFNVSLDSGVYQWRVKGINRSSATEFSYVNTLFIR